MKLFSLVFLSTILVSATQAFHLPKIRVDRLVKITAGIVDGILNKETGDAEMAACESDLKFLGSHLREAGHDFKQFNIDGFFDGMEILINLRHNRTNLMTGCRPLRQDLKRVKNWAKIFLDPVTVIERAIIRIPENMITLIMDVQYGYDLIRIGDYFGVGKDIGQMLTIVLGAPEK
eukprot:403350612